MSSVFHHCREKPKPSDHNKTRTVKNIGEEESPARDSSVCEIHPAKALCIQWRGQGTISEIWKSVLKDFGIRWRAWS